MLYTLRVVATFLRSDLSSCARAHAQKRNVSFLQKRFPVTPTRNYNHSQLGCITPIDGRVKDVS